MQTGILCYLGRLLKNFCTKIAAIEATSFTVECRKSFLVIHEKNGE